MQHAYYLTAFRIEEILRLDGQNKKQTYWAVDNTANDGLLDSEHPYTYPKCITSYFKGFRKIRML